MMEAMNTCPCVIADKPCQEHCSCIEEFSSHGCLCCIRYGSDEQHKVAANAIVASCQMKAYLLNDPNGKLWLAFGENCVQAAEHLVAKIGGDSERFSVGGSWEVNPNEPINISELWPYFTNQPGRHCK